MSGVEVAGLVLAVLPLVVNQLENYSRGLTTIKGLRRYRWELEGYSSNLSAQYAIFLNTLEIFLQDVVDDPDERSKLISNPKGPAWSAVYLKTTLADKLGRDYHPFTATITRLCSQLEELSARLDRETPDYSKAVSLRGLGTIKFRKILSKAVYEDILDKIDKANQILRTLSEQSHQLHQARKASLRSRKELNRYREGRRHAQHLYDILVQGQAWKCPCSGSHTVCFRLDFNVVHNSRNASHEDQLHFPMMVSAPVTAQGSQTQSKWHEIELRPEIHELSVPIDLPTGPESLSKGKQKVGIATSSTSVCVERLPQGVQSLGLITDLCSTLAADALGPTSQTENVGYMLEKTSGALYKIRLSLFQRDLSLHSLHDVLASSNSVRAPIQRSHEPSRRDRLYLAVILACGVLQLHKSWLKQHWRTKDVLFIVDHQPESTTFDQPYLVWRVRDSHTPGSHNTAIGHCIPNEILLPLAVALIELSLGKTMAALGRVEDQGPSEHQSQFNTATRVLRQVYYESGTNYGDAVKECLFWSRRNGERFEDPQFDQSVFDTVVSPLLEDFKYFEGISSPSNIPRYN
ncbi:hypothetical protein BJX61DRAFT_517611 [Aspergillus egyptiacus]|nr:hypothetical protein BJX61DRAFT_517611 [Aspergillus egyptiacus]